MQLHPRENFIITHQLNNPAYITDTSYVKAVIRNAKTDVVLDTLSLTDKGDGRFTVNWQVPADVSGQGFWVSIITTVYSDSGYTTQSQNYGVESNTYLVQERVNVNLGMGGGGGSDISYKKIREIIKEELDKMELEPVVVTKEIIKEVVKEVKIPETKIVETMKDLTPVFRELKKLAKQIEDKPVTEIPPQKELDLTPILSSLQMIKGDIGERMAELKEVVDVTRKTDTKEKARKALKEMLKNLDVEAEDEGKKSDARVTKIMKKI